ncbi:MAG: hypothetical protein LBU11_13295 [Zoogloeaceae bacterium]|jgi:hypothetical protein|nr:hypothetical protein [Zoogloeaceae bacterium]
MAIYHGPLNGIFSEPVIARFPHGELTLNILGGASMSAEGKNWTLHPDILAELPKLMQILVNYAGYSGGLWARLVDVPKKPQVEGSKGDEARQTVLNFGIINGMAPLGVLPDVAFYQDPSGIPFAYRVTHVEGKAFNVTYAPFLAADERSLAGTGLSLEPKSMAVNIIEAASFSTLDVHPSGGRTLHLVGVPRERTKIPHIKLDEENRILHVDSTAGVSRTKSALYEFTVAGRMSTDSFFMSAREIEQPTASRKDMSVITEPEPEHAVIHVESSGTFPVGAYYSASGGQPVILRIEYTCVLQGNYDEKRTSEQRDDDGDGYPEIYESLEMVQKASADQEFVFKEGGEEIYRASSSIAANYRFYDKAFMGEAPLQDAPPPVLVAHDVTGFSEGWITGDMMHNAHGVAERFGNPIGPATHQYPEYPEPGLQYDFNGRSLFALAPGIVQTMSTSGKDTLASAENAGNPSTQNPSYALEGIYYNGSKIAEGMNAICVNPLTGNLIMNSSMFSIKVPI